MKKNNYQSKMTYLETKNKISRQSYLKTAITYLIILIFSKLLFGIPQSKVFSTELKVKHLMPIDYILIVLIGLIIMFLLIYFFSKKRIYLYLATFSLLFCILIWNTSGLVTNSSYLCYGYDSFLHDILFPAIPPVNTKSVIKIDIFEGLEFIEIVFIDWIFCLYCWKYLRTYYGVLIEFVKN